MDFDTHLTPHSFKVMTVSVVITALVAALLVWGSNNRKLVDLAKCDPKERSSIIIEMPVGGTYTCVAPEKMQRLQRRPKKKAHKRAL